MNYIIYSDQSYCVPGRSIFDNIHFIRDLIHTSKLFGFNFGLFSMDQEKAFDRVEHEYLWRTMEAFNFSSVFLNRIKVLYGGIQSMLKVNGGLSAPFNVNRGIRQGCSLSGMLYTLAIEPLLNRLRSELIGLNIDDNFKPVCTSAYADDVLVIIKSQNDVEKTTLIVNEFGKISSAKVNWKKSSGLIVGDWRDEKPMLPGGLNWVSEGFKYLGVFLGNDSIEEKNWNGIEEMVDGKLKKWKWLHSCLSYRGRALIINNLVASILWHKLAVLELPADLLIKIQRKLVNFFWNKLHWIPQNVLYLSKELGGQGLVHLTSRKAAFRIQFVQKFLYGKLEVPWRHQ